jgi:hypothetical protein
MYRRSRLLGIGSIAIATLSAEAASAQTVTSPGNLILPNRIVNGQPLGTSTRPANLNPNGISYADCAADMQLQFSIEVSGFTGQNMAVWVSKTSDCTQTIDREDNGGNVCWFLQQPLTGYNSVTSNTIPVTLNVRDIVGEQNATASVVNYVKQGLSACFAQPSFSAVQFNVNFVPLDADGTLAGTSYLYTINTDMVGPPAPGNVTKSVGDMLLNVMWDPNVDTSTVGYDIFLSPIPGTDAAVNPVQTVDVCADSGSGSDAAACHVDNTGSSGESVDGGINYPCPNAALLTSAVSPDGGTAVTMDDGAADDGAVEDASTVDDSGPSTGSSVGGISTVPTRFIVKANNGTGMTVSDKTAGEFTITGLDNQVLYTATVAAVDAYGNIGPSFQPAVCDYPAPTQDFFQAYANSGGRGGGGYCALEAAGVPVPSLAGAGLLASAVALARRRKRRASREGTPGRGVS